MPRRMGPRLLTVLVGALATLALGTSTAAAAPGVVQDLSGCRAHQLPANDDGSTDAVSLGFTAHIYDSSPTEAYVNNNGNITFDASLAEYTPFDFREAGVPSIEPFFADVDTTSDDSGLTNYGTTTYQGHKAFCVIWDHVGYFNTHADKTNTFQAILVDRGAVGVDVVFNYDSVSWETGDLSGGADGFGGTSAAAGYAAGDGDASHAVILPGSFVNGGLLDSNATTGLAGHATAGQPAGRYVFQLRAGAATGGSVGGTVTDPAGDAVAGALVQLCPASGPCLTRIADASGAYRASNLPAGAYRITGFPGPNSALRSTSYDDVAVGAPGTQTTRDIELGPAPLPPPDGTTVGPRIDDDPDGVPTASWDGPLHLSTRGCAGGGATYTIVLEGRSVRSGAMTEGPSGTYTATVAALQPDHGTGEVRIHVDCPSGTPDHDVGFGIYIDPSGVVRDAAGNPAPGARVTLYRSASRAGPFFAVPDGSPVMSPSNRHNPDLTGAAGRFGWDVVAGYYVVKAQLGACSATSRVLSIPPPVTDLDLRLCAPPPPRGPVVVGPPPPQAQPQTNPTHPKSGRRRLAKLGRTKLLKGRTLVVKVACAKAAIKACSGKVGVKMARRSVGAKTFRKLKPRRSARVRVKLSKRGRKLVRRVKRHRKVRFALSVTVRDAAGKGRTVKHTVAIRRR